MNTSARVPNLMQYYNVCALKFAETEMQRVQFKNV